MVLHLCHKPLQDVISSIMDGLSIRMLLQCQQEGGTIKGHSYFYFLRSMQLAAQYKPAEAFDARTHCRAAFQLVSETSSALHSPINVLDI